MSIFDNKYVHEALRLVGLDAGASAKTQSPSQVASGGNKAPMVTGIWEYTGPSDVGIWKYVPDSDKTPPSAAMGKEAAKRIYAGGGLSNSVSHNIATSAKTQSPSQDVSGGDKTPPVTGGIWDYTGPGDVGIWKYVPDSDKALTAGGVAGIDAAKSKVQAMGISNSVPLVEGTSGTNSALPLNKVRIVGSVKN